MYMCAVLRIVNVILKHFNNYNVIRWGISDGIHKRGIHLDLTHLNLLPGLYYHTYLQQPEQYFFPDVL